MDGTDTAYADSRLLVVAHGILHLSSPGSPSVIAVEALHRLDTPADARSSRRYARGRDR
jgi:hypothetical protein